MAVHIKVLNAKNYLLFQIISSEVFIASESGGLWFNSQIGHAEHQEL